MTYKLKYRIKCTVKITKRVQQKLLDSGCKWCSGSLIPIIPTDKDHYLCVQTNRQIFNREVSNNDFYNRDIENWATVKIIEARNFLGRSLRL